MDNKYVKLHSIVRMLAALLAIIVFISMFIADQAVSDGGYYVINFRNGAFFGSSLWKGNPVAFFGYLFVLFGGLAGLAFVFVDEIIGKDLTNKLSFVAGILALVGAIAIVLYSPLFKGINGFNNSFCHTGAAPIIFGIFSVLVGCGNIAAPILEKKGK